MNRLVCLMLFALVSANAVSSAEEDSVTYYIQLLRGTNQEEIENTKAKEIGPRLKKRLSPVFRWKNYWEVKRTAVKMQPGRVAMVPLSKDRALEIELIGRAESEIRLYTKGALLRKARQPLYTRMSIMGGDSEDDCWFVVVRRDPPQ